MKTVTSDRAIASTTFFSSRNGKAENTYTNRRNNRLRGQMWGSIGRKMSSGGDFLGFKFEFRIFGCWSVQVCSSFHPDLDKSGPELGRSRATSKLEANWPDLDNRGSLFLDVQSYSKFFSFIWYISILLSHPFFPQSRSGAVPKLEEDCPDRGENWSLNAGNCGRVNYRWVICDLALCGQVKKGR